MTDQAMASQMASKDGFIAALDQSGGSTPGALKDYGIPPDAYQGDAEMFALMHQMRVRVMTAPAFTGEKVIGAILFEQTMNGRVGNGRVGDGEAEGRPVPAYLWHDRGVVPFLKVDKGLQDARDHVRLMKPMPGLDALLERARGLGVYGTKMRSVVEGASREGIAAIVKQQFEIGDQIIAHGLMPILEPEVSIKASDKAEAEAMLRDEIQRHLDTGPADRRVMLKLTIPTKPDLYAPLIKHERVARVVALSGGYSRDEACEKLALCHGMIASFSRALLAGLSRDMTEAAFDAALGRSIEQIYGASTQKH